VVLLLKKNIKDKNFESKKEKKHQNVICFLLFSRYNFLNGQKVTKDLLNYFNL
jgi:hypothetical protein